MKRTQNELPGLEKTSLALIGSQSSAPEPVPSEESGRKRADVKLLVAVWWIDVQLRHSGRRCKMALK
jgi:hypothetical protein